MKMEINSFDPFNVVFKELLYDNVTASVFLLG
jgi:hypothetical protein